MLTRADLQTLFAISRDPELYWAGTPFPALSERGLILPVSYRQGSRTWRITDAGLDVLKASDARVVALSGMIAKAMRLGLSIPTVKEVA